MAIPFHKTYKARDIHARIGVYGWFRPWENDPLGFECLYIGKSSSILRRINTHEVIGVFSPVSEKDEIRIWDFDSGRDAAAFERKLIKQFKPKYNITYCKKRKA